MKIREIVVLTGPTASGKSEVCRRLAENFGYTIVNCDSKQIYRDVPSITDQPSFLLNNKQFRLYSYVDPRCSYSAGIWLEDAKREILQAWNNGTVPVVTGGSGLYISSLIYGLSSIPLVDENVRAKARSLLASAGKEEFYKLLLEKDKQAVQLDKNNSHQLLRAFEVIEQTGTSIFTFRSQSHRQSFLKKYTVCVLAPPREEVYARINSRFMNMVRSSAISEVEYLMSLNLPEHMPIMKVHGAPEIMKYLQGSISLERAIEIAQRNTRRYAKRQYTWFSTQLPKDSSRFDNKYEITSYIVSRCSRQHTTS